jgi:hypothetical protein
LGARKFHLAAPFVTPKGNRNAAVGPNGAKAKSGIARARIIGSSRSFGTAARQSEIRAFFARAYHVWPDLEVAAKDLPDACTPRTIARSSSIKVGKKSAGRLLDGREWNEFPQTRELKPSVAA